ncbi:MAG: FAD:protein FMN transferase [Gammaproteobacteria bacterium]|nr:FAD:protein FMN transferase [Gammaproteobacteria bacterium]
MKNRIIIVLATLVLSSCDNHNERYHQEQITALDDSFQWTLHNISPAAAKQVSDKIKHDLEFMSFAWHPWKPGPIGRVNQLLQSGGEFSINPSILPLVTRSQNLYQASLGTINPAAGKLFAMWGLHSEQPYKLKTPAPSELDQYLAHLPTMQHIQLNGIRAKATHLQLQLDFRAFTTGLAIERMVSELKQSSIHHAMIQTSYGAKALGHQGEKAWSRNIPISDGTTISIELSDGMSVFTQNNQRPTISPLTGLPVTDTISVTVADPDAALANAAATALFIAGEEKWHEIARSMGIKYALLLTNDGRIHMNPAMRAQLTLEPELEKRVILSAPLITQ